MKPGDPWVCGRCGGESRARLSAGPSLRVPACHACREYSGVMLMLVRHQRLMARACRAMLDVAPSWFRSPPSYIP